MTDIAEANGQWLRRHRQARGWSVPQMGSRLREAARSVSDTLPGNECLLVMIRRWEAGKSGTSERYRLHYCKVFEVPMDQFGRSPVPVSIGIDPKADCPFFTKVDNAPDQSAENPPSASPTDQSDELSRRHQNAEAQSVSDEFQVVCSQFLEAAYESRSHALEAERRDIGNATLEHFRAALIRLCRESLGGEPGALFLQIRSVRDQLHPVTATHIWPKDQHELYRVA